MVGRDPRTRRLRGSLVYLRPWIFNILANTARTRAVRDARSLPFSAIEDEAGPAVDPAAFAADGRWTSAPPRLDYDPETGLLRPSYAGSCWSGRGAPPAQRAVITLRDLLGFPPRMCATCSS